MLLEFFLLRYAFGRPCTKMGKRGREAPTGFYRLGTMGEVKGKRRRQRYERNLARQYGCGVRAIAGVLLGFGFDI